MRVSPVALAAALLVTGATPALAQAPTLTINPTPTTVKPGDVLTVSGDGDCGPVSYTVTLTTNDPEGNAQQTTATGTADADGNFVQQVTVPDDATARDPASVMATMDCDGTPVTSNAVNLQVDPHLGELAASPAEGHPGDEVEISGTNCWGGDVEVIFGDGFEFDYAVAVPDVTLAQDKTFTGTFTIPDIDAGPYVFVAGCPGTEYEFATFEVLAAVVEPPLTPAPPAVPVPATPTFTG